MRKRILRPDARLVRVVLEAVEGGHLAVLEDARVEGPARVRGARAVLAQAGELGVEAQVFVLPGLQRELGVDGDGVQGGGGAGGGVGEGGVEGGGCG